ncbi:heterokaryon incompatibility protein-domain-containing protein [Dactylonectria macrodidyma]|uniref:Heterokaryon incompatibility protein-domain-containing protein n=1 Tax=Dactylonectria macrodidyma TaxID=307937 RepID=A0A9P9JJD8_9HYPO|nr:heterokaryon incompatibility protein-domain-containing protein [Dactylonectria macrodidyma]
MTMEPTTLCKDCLNFGQDPALLTDDLNYTLKPTSLDLRKSARNGCPSCKAFLHHIEDQIARSWTKEAMGEGPIRIKAWPYPEGLGECIVQISRDGEGLQTTDFSFSISMSAGDPGSEDTRTRYRCVEPHSGSAACTRRISDLLNMCQQDHPQCASLVQDAHLPTRVLDLTLSSPDVLRIFETKGQQIKAPYVTLSHCWGKFDPTKLILKEGNLAELTTQFAYNRLAPVFRDAVDLTRGLGLRYLWIDALCIIQDSKLDWAAESMLMASVYAHATLNIAAASSPDSNTPFLRPRTFTPDVHLPFTSTQTGKKGTVALRPLYQNSDNVVGHLGQPLQSRAWCFQERILATRTVFFDDDLFLWECHRGYIPENLASITSLDNFHYGNRSMFPYNKPSRIVASSPPATVRDAWGALAEHWYKCLDEFGLRRLTYTDDALPAMSAIAEHFGNLTKDSYLAGIWKSELHRGLLWQVTDLREQDAIRSSTAPSWSWASLFHDSGSFMSSVLLQPLRYHATSDNDAQLLDVKLDPIHGNLIGQMRRASLHMKGLTKTIILNSKPNQGFNTIAWIPTSQQFELSICLDDDFFFSTCNQSFQARVEVLAFFLSQWNYNYHFRDVVVFGLLLTPATNTRNQEFVRCGTFEVKPGPRDEKELAEHRQRASRMQKLNPRKESFEGIWDSWDWRNVVIV